MEKYARKCNITGEGMNSGWCWLEGTFYSKYESDTVDELRGDLIHEGIDCKLWSDDEVLEYGFNEDILYYTEWDEYDAEYVMIDNNLVEI